MPSSKPSPDVSAPPVARPSAPRRSRRRISHELWIAIVTATSTVAAAAIGTVVAVDAGTIEVRVVGDGLDSAELRNAVDQLEAENAELRSVNEDIQAQITELQLQPEGATRGPDSDDSPNPAPGNDTVRRTTPEPIGLAVDGCIDLDSDAPNWDVGTEGDICISSLWQNLVGADLTVLDDEPSMADCEAQTNVRDDVGSIEAVVGRYVCAWTDAGRLARIKVVDVEPTENGNTESATLEVTVWDRQL